MTNKRIESNKILKTIRQYLCLYIWSNDTLDMYLVIPIDVIFFLELVSPSSHDSLISFIAVDCFNDYQSVIKRESLQSSND